MPSSFRRSASVRNRIANDAQSKALILEMVTLGTDALKANWQYKTYAATIEDIIRNDTHFNRYLKDAYEDEDKEESFFSAMFLRFTGDDEVNEPDTPTSGTTSSTNRCETKVAKWSMAALVEYLIEETLRFLAMKILMDGQVVELVASSDLTEKHDNKMEKMVLQLCPSEPIRAAWKNLLLFPLTYGEVCETMGSYSTIDYTDENHVGVHNSHLLQGKLSAEMWSLECYEWTLKTYGKFFRSDPSPVFWPERVATEHRNDDNDGRGWSSGMSRLTQNIRDTVKKPCVSLEDVAGDVEQVPKCVSVSDKSTRSPYSP